MTDGNDGYVFDISECPVVEDIEDFFGVKVHVRKDPHAFLAECHACGEHFLGESHDVGDAVWSMLDDMEDHFKNIATQVSCMKEMVG